MRYYDDVDSYYENQFDDIEDLFDEDDYDYEDDYSQFQYYDTEQEDEQAPLRLVDATWWDK